MDLPACFFFMSYQVSCRPNSLYCFQLLSPLWHFIASVLFISGSNASSLIQDRISFISQKMTRTLPPEQNKYATEAALENSSLLSVPFSPVSSFIQWKTAYSQSTISHFYSFAFWRTQESSPRYHRK